MGRSRLLVVDGNPVWRETIAHILETNHELVGTVVRGDEIMESSERLCPDVILDVSLPGMSGLNVLSRLRKACPRAIIAIVRLLPPIYREEASLRGADGYVEKRRVFSDFLSTIASIWNIGPLRFGIGSA